MINKDLIAVAFIIVITLCTNIFLRYLYKKYYISNKVEIYKKSRNKCNKYITTRKNAGDCNNNKRE